MPAPNRVLIADFLDECSVEAPVLDGLAEITLARGRTEGDLLAHVESADAMILYHDIPHVGPELFDRSGKLRGIVRAGVGYNNVDLDAASERGIVVCNVPDYGTEEVADHAVTLLLAVVRQLRQGDAAIRAGTWDFRTVAETTRLRGQTLGLVGCGRIGTAAALRAKAFGLDVVFFDPFAPPGLDKAIGVRRADRLEDLLEQSRFVSIHCYLDATTHHMIDGPALALMPRGSVLVNTARGGVVSNDALVAALDSGHLLGAGLDVFEREPLDDDRLRHHPRVVLSPHSAFYSREAFVELRRKTAEEVRRLLLGEPLRCPVNAGRLVGARAGQAS